MFKFNEKPKYRAHEDTFILLRKLFYDFGHTRTYKILNKYSVYLHICVHVLQFCYIYRHPDTDFSRYSTMLINMTFVLASMIFSIFLDKDINEIIQALDSKLWSIHSVDPRVSKKIQYKSRKFNYLFTYALLVLTGSIGVVSLSVWGSEDELYLSVLTFKDLFGSWSSVIKHFYFCTFSFAAYSIFRLPFLMLYVFLQLEIQFYLVNKHILAISIDDNVENVHKWVIQKDIQRKIIFCVKQHSVLKRFVIQLFEIIKRPMPIFLFLGGLSSISLMVFILLHLESLNAISTVRLFLVVCVNIMTVWTFCEAGQRIIDESGATFDSLVKCPWYSWNTKNRRLLVMFMVNSRVPVSFYLAGITLDYTLTVNIYRISFTNALVFYNLNQNS
ncbi:hypothetical protein Zmor_012310 [Zophobas morio]|uniref:Odorant receptor n=1 Tax=Zophobas morio TaxID=2755281 RepID=A0AA38HHI8_9CUCU|nr:hypothetical protein Zmor_012310 [Zophobas morio]